MAMAMAHARSSSYFHLASDLLFYESNHPSSASYIPIPLLASHARIYGVPPSQLSHESVAQQELCISGQPCFSLNVRAAYLSATSRPSDPVLIWEGSLSSRSNDVVLRMTEHTHRGNQRRLFMTIDSVVLEGQSSPRNTK